MPDDQVIITPLGEEAQVDYGDGAMVRDPQTGKYRPARLFVRTLGASRKAVRFLTKFLTKCGAPKGSKLQYEKKGKPVETPFGEAEGLALYLNGTDLPKKVYKDCDINDLYEEITRLLGKHGRIEGHWQGPSETALYLYGKSAKKMQSLISDHIAAYPLCQKSRLVVIA